MHDAMDEVIGFIGIGLMGQPIAARLLDAGHAVLVWNRTPGRCDELVDAGAEEAESLAALVDASDVLVLCVADTAAVQEVVFGPEGIADRGSEEQLLIDLSSIDPVATRNFATELEQACGMAWVDAPVSGGVSSAEDGTLVVFAGGHEEDIERARPLFEAIAARVTRMGGVGAGQLTKVCNQMIVGCTALVIGEMIGLAERAGIDAERLPGALAGGLADSRPLQTLGPRMAVRQYEPVLGRLRTLQKDLDTVLAVAGQVDAAVPMSALAAQLVRQHRVYTDEAADCSTLVELFAAE
jgi:3-hydroxyisobutyrate dehydrogenase